MPAHKPSPPSGGPLVPQPENAALDRVLALALPPLLPGESKADFAALAAHVVAAAEPKDAIDEILVRDVIDLTWEIQRLRRAKGALVTVAMGDGVQQVLYAIGHGDHFQREALGEGWVAGRKNAQHTVQKALSDASLSVDHVTAKTLEIKLDSIERLDRMLSSAEARRNNALREIERHREALGVAAPKEVEDVPFVELDTGVVHQPSD